MRSHNQNPVSFLGNKVKALRNKLRTFWDRRQFRWLRRMTQVIMVRDEEYRYFVSTSDDSIGFKLFRGHKKYLSDGVERLCEWGKAERGLFQDPNKVFLNVGANIGCATVPAVCKGYFKTAIVFEPEPFNFKLLKANLILNNVNDRVLAFPVALSNQDITKRMYVSTHNFGSHAVFGDGSSAVLSDRDRENDLQPGPAVACRTLDSVMEEQRVDAKDLGLAFVDVEGHEGHFLEGATKLLVAGIPIYTEFCPPLLKRSQGLDIFMEKATAHFSSVVVNPINHKSAYPVVQDIAALESIRDSTALYDLLLLP